MQKKSFQQTRRQFIKTSGYATGATMLSSWISKAGFGENHLSREVPLYAHLWVYASRYPPDWDCTPILDDVFSDLKYAGLQGVELMEVLLRHNDAVSRLTDLINKH